MTTNANDPKGMQVGKYSPWGCIQAIVKINDGIYEVGTASHGGYKLNASMNKRIPEVFRIKGGWYEEDCAWAIVRVFLDEFFPYAACELSHASRTLRNYFWKQYEQCFGIELSLDESEGKRYDTFMCEHANDWIGVSAVGSWHKDVPEGKVGVTATVGGVRDPNVEHRYFLVDADDYAKHRSVYLVKPTDEVWMEHC